VFIATKRSRRKIKVIPIEVEAVQSKSALPSDHPGKLPGGVSTLCLDHSFETIGTKLNTRSSSAEAGQIKAIPIEVKAVQSKSALPSERKNIVLDEDGTKLMLRSLFVF
jgi:hypothetical protein